MRKRSELLFNLLLVPLDSFALLSSWVLAFLVRVEYSLKPTVYQVPGREYLAILIALAPVTILFFALAGLYNFDSTRSRWHEYSRVLIATSASTMFLIIVDFFATKPIFPSKAIVIYGLLFASLSIITTRFVLNSFQRWLFRFGIGRRRVIVIGKGEAADAVTYALQQEPGYEVKGISVDAKSGWQRLEGMLNAQTIDEVVLAEYDLPAKQQVSLIQLTHQYHIGYKFVPTIAGLYQTRSHSSLMANLPLIEVVRTPLDGWWRIYKTLFDYFFGVLALVLLLPVFVLIAIIIKLTDGGPIFYKHARIGRDGKEIHVWKFRSMYTKYSTGTDFGGQSDAEVLASLGDEKLAKEFARDQKLRKDPRVTPIGGFLRRTSLDEFPQLINVLRSELSLIGPRPVTDVELKRYGTSAATFLLIKPGITGLWQVSGRNDVSYEERVKLDIFYVENWSAWQDIRIIFRTILIMFSGKGY